MSISFSTMLVNLFLLCMPLLIRLFVIIKARRLMPHGHHGHVNPQDFGSLILKISMGLSILLFIGKEILVDKNAQYSPCGEHNTVEDFKILLNAAITLSVSSWLITYIAAAGLLSRNERLADYFLLSNQLLIRLSTYSILGCLNFIHMSALFFLQATRGDIMCSRESAFQAVIWAFTFSVAGGMVTNATWASCSYVTRGKG